MPTALEIIRSKAAAHSPAPAPVPLAALVENARKWSPDHAAYAEVQRITGMPMSLPMDDNEREVFNRMHVQGAAFESGFRLFQIQSDAMMAYELYQGGFFPIGVGWGKTLLDLMIANHAWQAGMRKILLLVPSQILGQLIGTDIQWARTKVAITFPVHVLGGRPAHARRMLSHSGKAGLYVLPYSCLSTKDASENIDAIAPQLIICDEAHNLANRTAARTRRLMAYIDRHKPRGVCLSGTITAKSVIDYYHLIRWCLGVYNPLPNAATMAQEWAIVLDAAATAGGVTETSAATGPLVPLIRWAQQHFPAVKFESDVASFRRAYKLRLNTAPGVAASGDSEIGTSLILANQPVAKWENSPGADTLKSLIERIQDQWLTPNGDEIEHAIHTWKWLYELSAGFYNELTWPTAEVLAERRKISLAEADELLIRAKVHHSTGQQYAHLLRDWIDRKSRPGCDTPMLVGKEMSLHGAANVGSELYDAWRDWKDLDFDGRPERDSRAVRVCDYKVKAAVEWASALDRDTGALLWVHHQEMGRWVFDALKEAGLDALHAPAGDIHNAAILDPANGKKLVVASITAHGTGKNLQHFEQQYFVQWPRQAVAAEQALGRTHRNGQKADELVVVTNHTMEFDELNFAACLNDALYIHQTTGNRQKVIYANYDPMPKIFPPAVLKERGLQNVMLTAEQQGLLNAKFSQK